ncbi:conserved hypothetical protein [Ricinus communis]|uniref:Uncharacterized protein n=1 Tax=Ricinus communis TaxID=3988 RepID=B9TCS0_RICCO|nr:conserved hypothetical protein [Ricinus communis]
MFDRDFDSLCCRAILLRCRERATTPILAADFSKVSIFGAFSSDVNGPRINANSKRLHRTIPPRIPGAICVTSSGALARAAGRHGHRHSSPSFAEPSKSKDPDRAIHATRT